MTMTATTISTTNSMPTGQGAATMQKTTPDLVPGETTDIPVLTMVGPMLGFPEHQRFGLARLDEQGSVCDLRSLDDPELRFVVVPPHLFFPDYAPVITDATAEQLEARTADDLIALVVVTLGEGLSQATANLLAPVLVNPERRLAAQVVLDDAGLSLRAPLIPEHAPES
jgi:flagellar assembly factor FliW